MPLLLLALLLPARADTLFPPLTELARALDAYHGPCGHQEGERRLSHLLLELLPPGRSVPLLADVVECSPWPDPRPLDSPREALFRWLARYDRNPESAWNLLETQLTAGPAVHEPVLIAAAYLTVLDSAELREARLYTLRQVENPALRRLVLDMQTGGWRDPWTRGFDRGFDATGAVYRMLLHDLQILPACDCPAEPRGTPVEQAWAMLFLGLHPAEGLPTQPAARARHPAVSYWLAQWASEDALLRAQAAVVLWRLAETP